MMQQLQWVLLIKLLVKLLVNYFQTNNCFNRQKGDWYVLKLGSHQQLVGVQKKKVLESKESNNTRTTKTQP